MGSSPRRGWPPRCRSWPSACSRVKATGIPVLDTRNDLWFPRIDVLAALGQGLGPLTKGDFNADGKPDLPWQDATTGDVYVWFMRDTSLSSGTYVAQGMEAWKVVGPK